MKRPAMGRGLSALLDNNEDTEKSKNILSEKVNSSLNFALIPLHYISANPFQPRTVFEEQALIELSNSIKALGIIQPVTVRKVGDDKYQLISGGRRFKASEMAELKEIPAYIRTADDTQMLEMALVENIQRQELDPIEIAISFQRLIEECNLTHDALSSNVGKNRSTITNYLRLLKLPAEIQIALRNKVISMGHARALININEPGLQLNIFKTIIKQELSVRKVEELVRASEKNSKTSKNKISVNQYKNICDSLNNLLNAKVIIKRNNNGRGSINIRFSSEEELNRIINYISKQ